MKRIISLILICAFVMSFCGCGLLFGEAKYDFSYSDSDKYSAGDTEIKDASDLSKIHVSWYSGDVIVKTHSEDTVIIEETAEGVEDDVHRVHYYYYKSSYGDVLDVQFGKSGVENYDGVKKNVSITVPENDEYYIGIISHGANVTVDTSEYNNTLEKLSITTEYGAVHANIYNADTVQIAGYNQDKGAGENRIYELDAVGYISTLGFNSSYAEVKVSADTVYSMDNFGSAYCKTYFNVRRAGNIKVLATHAEAYVNAEEFTSIEITGREKPVYIDIPDDTQFTLDITREKVYDSDKDMVSDVVEIGFENVNKVSDTKYTVGNGEKSIKITTFNAIYINAEK